MKRNRCEIQSSELECYLFSYDDLNLLFNFNSSIENLAYIPRTPFKSLSEAEILLLKFVKSMEEGTAVWWSFYEKSSGTAVGYGGLFDIDCMHQRAEIGYGFLKGNWGKGYGTSIVNFITQKGFKEHRLHRIYGLVDPENVASLRVLEKNGYVKEGLMSDYFYARGRYFDMCLMARINK